jgi:predicted amino acid-binding ACT domain protein
MGRPLLRCHDRPGLIAAVSSFLTQAGANIISLDQHSTAPENGTFLQLAMFHLPGLTAEIDGLGREFASTMADKFNIDYRFTEAARRTGRRTCRSHAYSRRLDSRRRRRRTCGALPRGALALPGSSYLARQPDHRFRWQWCSEITCFTAISGFNARTH